MACAATTPPNRPPPAFSGTAIFWLSACNPQGIGWIPPVQSAGLPFNPEKSPFNGLRFRYLPPPCYLPSCLPLATVSSASAYLLRPKSRKSPQTVCFHTTTDSFAATKKSSPLVSMSSKLFWQNTRGGGYPSRESLCPPISGQGGNQPLSLHRCPPTLAGQRRSASSRLLLRRLPHRPPCCGRGTDSPKITGNPGSPSRWRH